jgi:cell wall integrity and stress response component
VAPAVIVTEPAAAPQEKSGPNVGAIAGGVVVGVLAIAGVIGGMFFYMRKKRNKEIEEEHQRHAAVNSFISGKSSSGGSITDARLAPVMAQRRMSDGSLADNHDYSRKILRVRCHARLSS